MLNFRKKQKKLYYKSVDTWTPESSMTHFNFSYKNDINTALNTVPELAAIVNYIAKSFSSGIWNHNDLEKSWLLDLLANPHPLYSENELKQLIARELISYGVCFLYVQNNSVISNAKSIAVLPTHLTSANTKSKNKDILNISSAKEIISNYSVKWEDGVEIIGTENIITISLSNIVSISNNKINYESPLKPLDKVLKVSESIYETMHELNFNRGAVGIISNDNTDASGTIPMTSEEIEELQKQYKRYGTLKDKWHIMFSDTKLSFQPISSPIKDMMLVEQLKQVKQTIADVLGFDTLLLNNQDGNKYANYNEARKSFFSELIQPLADTVSNSLNDYFLRERPKEKLTLDYSHLDVFAADKEKQAKTIEIETAYIISLNKSVANNEMTRNNAINLLIQNGYTEDNAKKIIQ